MMRIIFFLAFTGSTIAASAQLKDTKKITNKGYEIPLILKPIKNAWVYLYSYYGKNYQIADSAFLNAESKGLLKGSNKLPGGIYLLVLEHKLKLFDVLMDNVQQFSITADTANLQSTVIVGSKENDLYVSYSKFLSQKAPRLNTLQQQLQIAKTAADSANIRAQLAQANKELNDYREAVIKENPNSMLAAFFQTVKRPEVPLMPTLTNGKLDSLYPARFIKEHYWDDVSFSDDRLLRTPFFDPKLEEYFKYYVAPDPDSVIQEVNYMLLSARESKDMFKYLLGKFTDKYINPEIMGQDKVFLFLFNNFFSKGDTSWLTAKQKEFIFNRAYSLMANQIGEPAAPLILTDTLNKGSSLYNLKAPFTFIVFWDPNCSHCKTIIPQIDSIYEASWKKLGVKVYAVNTEEGTQAAWKNFIKEHHLDGWAHVYQTKAVREAEIAAHQPSFRQLYDVFQTPTLYLLDNEKRIIAKKLSIAQFNDVIQTKLRQIKN